jgi:hypothetical protein
MPLDVVTKPSGLPHNTYKMMNMHSAVYTNRDVAKRYTYGSRLASLVGSFGCLSLGEAASLRIPEKLTGEQIDAREWPRISGSGQR